MTTTAPSHLASHALALIGRGIGQSRSPAIHEAEGRRLGLPLTYRLVDFDALGLAAEDLPRVVRLLAGIGYSGANVTYPFKQEVMPLCDSLSPAAEALGAVNTLCFRDGAIHGENTDWLGFAWLLEREIGAIAGQRVAQIGTGGAGAATAYALARCGAGEVALFDPAPGRAADLAVRLAPLFPDCRFSAADRAAAAIAGAAGVVNATPVGMAKLPGTPFDPALMDPAQWVADVIYFPLETELLAAARARGQTIANGISMVVGQAAEAFRLITGAEPDREAMLARLSAAIRDERAGGPAR
jgi:shikimate dehydrogenase